MLSTKLGAGIPRNEYRWLCFVFSLSLSLMIPLRIEIRWILRSGDDWYNYPKKVTIHHDGQELSLRCNYLGLSSIQLDYKWSLHRSIVLQVMSPAFGCAQIDGELVSLFCIKIICDSAVVSLAFPCYLLEGN